MSLKRKRRYTFTAQRVAEITVQVEAADESEARLIALHMVRLDEEEGRWHESLSGARITLTLEETEDVKD